MHKPAAILKTDTNRARLLEYIAPYKCNGILLHG